MRRFYIVLSGLLLGLGVIIRVSAITDFAIMLSYALIGIGLLGIIGYWLLRARFK